MLKYVIVAWRGILKEAVTISCYIYLKNILPANFNIKLHNWHNKQCNWSAVVLPQHAAVDLIRTKQYIIYRLRIGIIIIYWKILAREKFCLLCIKMVKKLSVVWDPFYIYYTHDTTCIACNILNLDKKWGKNV